MALYFFKGQLVPPISVSLFADRKNGEESCQRIQFKVIIIKFTGPIVL
jgi:hypothetical protein